MIRIHRIDRVRVLTALLCTAIVGGLCPIAYAQVIRDSVPELQKIDIVEHLRDTIPLDLAFVNERGDSVTLGQYFGHGKPVILTLAYSNCPMLCSVVLDGLTNGVRGLDWNPGQEFQMLTVSIDPKETFQTARARRDRYLQSLPKVTDTSGWTFLVGSEASSQALADAIGFKYYYDPDLKQYAHPAGAFIITDQGVVARYFYGVEFKPRDLGFALMEASNGRIGSTVDRIILYCYHYDPGAKGYVLFAGNLMRAGGVVTMLLLGGFLVLMWRRERRLRATIPHPTPAAR